MNGYQYEQKCARYLRAMGFRHVEVTNRSSDQGIDLLASHHGRRYAVQCKLYSHPVGNHAVMEAFAGAKYYHCRRAIVMTNNTFTAAAEKLAGQTGVLLWPGCHAGSGLLGCLAGPLRILALLLAACVAGLVGRHFLILPQGSEWLLAGTALAAPLLLLAAGRRRVGAVLAALCGGIAAWLIARAPFPGPWGLGEGQTTLVALASAAALLLHALGRLRLSPIPKELRNRI